MRRNCVRKIKKFIPLYEESTKIKEEHIESYDSKFYG
jgi:hypothetical protein